MKKIKQIFIYLLLITSVSTIGQTITNGFVKYAMTSDNEEMAMMGEVIITNYFNETDTAVEIDIMSGMMITKVYTKFSEPDKPIITMDAMGNKFQITGVEGKDKGETDFSDVKNMESVTYDKKDIKEIQGHKCYKANIKYINNKTGVFYLTEKIAPKKPENAEEKVKLSGFPLEMIITSEEGTLTIIATEISKDLPKDSFIIPEDFEKITMEEFTERMGG